MVLSTEATRSDMFRWDVLMVCKKKKKMFINAECDEWIMQES